jgi:WD40 repeat protein
MRPSAILILAFCAVINRPATAQEIRWMLPSSIRPTTLVTHSNQVFVTGSAIGTIQQWDMKEQRFVRTIGAHYHGGPIAVSPDGQFLVSVETSQSYSPVLWVWDLTSGMAHCITNNAAIGNGFLGFQPGRIAILSGRGELRYWDLATHNFTGEAIALSDISAENGFVTVPSKDGIHAATVSNQRLDLYDLNTAQHETIPMPVGERAWNASFSPDGQKIAVNSLSSNYTNPTLRVWNLQTRQFENTFALQGALLPPVFAPDRPILVVANSGEIQFWDLQQNQIVQRIPVNNNGGLPSPFGFSGDGKIFISGEFLLDQQTGALTPFIPALGTVFNVIFNPNSSRLVVQSYGHVLRDAANGDALYAFTPPNPQAAQAPPGHTYGSGNSLMGGPSPIYFFGKGTKVAIGGSIYDLANTNFYASVPQQTNDYNGIFALGENYFVKSSRSLDAAGLYSYTDGSLIQNLRVTNTAGASAVAISHSGQVIATGGGYTAPADDFHDEKLHIWSSAGGAPIITFTNEQRFPFKIAFSPDDQFVASGAMQNGAELNVFHIPSRRQVAAFRNPYAASLAFDFLPDNRTLVMGSTHVIEFFDLITSNHVATITNEANYITALAASPDGRTIAAGRWDGSLLMYSTPSLDYLDIMNPAAGPTITFNGRSNVNYVLESSANFRDWTALTNITGVGATFHYPIQPAQSTYYRLRLP